MINPIKPNRGLWISLNINKRYCSPETPKRHCRWRNHTRVFMGGGTFFKVGGHKSTSKKL